MNKIYKDIHDKILKSKHIALISHKFPDGDALGSTTAMYEMIKINFKDKKVDMINIDGIATKLAFLPNSDKIITKFDYTKYDTCIFLDVGSIYLAGFGEKSDYKYNFIINLDHHASNISYGDLNLVQSRKSSTASVLYSFFNEMGYKFNSNIATSLLAGIYTDTGSFIYSNVQPQTFYMAARLVDLGGDIDVISRNFFLNNTFSFVKLLGLVLKRLRISKDGVGLSYLDKNEILESGCKYEELDGIVWRLNMLDNVKYVCFLYEKGDIVKGSLRTTREDVDLTDIVKQYNGGGHKKATGFALDGKLEIEDSGVVNVRLMDNNIINFF